ncbi:MAG: hypothetical protein L0177_19385, partial [Chloroflexi bacterium]|nr:hypothetical protein [Chloroflexota bacterium]
LLEQASGLRLVFQRILLFDRFQVRDTALKHPLRALDLRGADYWGFDVLNEHDQTVLVELIGGDSRAPSSLGAIGVSASIAANTNEPIVTDIWIPTMAVRISYSTQPTAGQITVYGFARKWVRGFVL